MTQQSTIRLFVLAVALTFLGGGCATLTERPTGVAEVKKKPVRGKVELSKADDIESFALWDGKTKVDSYVLKRGAKARGTGRGY